MALTDRFATFVLLGLALAVVLVFFIPFEGATFDQRGYYTWLTSLVFDGDLEQTNDLLDSTDQAAMAAASVLSTTDRGFAANPWSVGPAALWAPAVAPWVAAERALLDPAAWGPTDRFAWRYRWITSLVTFLIGCHALLMLYHVLRRWFTPGVALASAALAIFGSSNLVYMCHWSAMAHTQSLWAAVLVLWLADDLQLRGPRRPGGKDWALGMAVGIAALMRWSGAVWAAVPAAIYLDQIIRSRGPRWWPAAGAALAAAGSLTAFLPQLVAWRLLYGHWLLIPQGLDFVYSGERHLRLAEVLFSCLNGLFYSHPWTLAASLGLVLWVPRAGALGIGLTAVVLAQWLLNASLVDWLGAVTFGARRSCEVMPAFAIGWAAVITLLPAGRPRRILGGGASGALIALNLVMALLWSRDIIREDWWGQLLPVAGDLLGTIASRPTLWIESPLALWLDGVSGHAWVPLLFLAAVITPLGLAAWAFRRGKPPWPARRAGPATAAATLFFVSLSGALLWAGARSDALAEIVGARQLLRAAPHPWYDNLDPAAFDHSEVPVLLALSAEADFRAGRVAEGLTATRSLAHLHPRCALLQAAEFVREPEQRASLVLEALERARWGDLALEDFARATAQGLRRQDVLQALLRRPASRPERTAQLLAAAASIAGQASLEARFLERQLAMNPAAFGTALRLAEMADARGDSGRADALRAHVRRVSTARMNSYRRLARIDDPTSPWYLRSHAEACAVWLISVLNPITDRTAIEGAVDFTVSFLHDPDSRTRLERHVFFCRRRWAAAHRDPATLQVLLRDIEAYAASHEADPDSFLALSEVRSGLSDWRGALEAIERGRARHPHAGPWQEMATFAASQLAAAASLEAP